MDTTITAHNHGLSEGMTVMYTVHETRWLVRLWYYIAIKKCPRRKIVAKITAVDSKTSFTVKKRKFWE